jgi:hypothetical protein
MLNTVAHIKKLIATDSPLIGMETDNISKIEKLYLGFTKNSTSAAYLWEQGEGLYRTDSPQIIIPKTKTEIEVLKYILTIPHYGIYLLKKFNAYLQTREMQSALNDIILDNTHRAILLLDNKLSLPPHLQTAMILAGKNTLHNLNSG